MNCQLRFKVYNGRKDNIAYGDPLLFSADSSEECEAKAKFAMKAMGAFAKAVNLQAVFDGLYFKDSKGNWK